MKKLLVIVFTLLSCAVMAQKPVQTLGNKGNITKVLGELSVDSAILFPKDTIQLLPTDRGIAFKGTNVYQWDGQRWGLITASGGVEGSVLNDSTFLLCNSNGCDTFVVRNISISSFSFISDSTVSVCNTAGSCDTISFNPVPLNKFYVDSAKIIPGVVDTMVYYTNGIRYVGGYINHLSPVEDGRISGGFVSWVSGLTFDVSASIFRKFGVLYYTRDTTITLDSADANYNRIDLFALDTTNGGEVIKITGTPSPIPVAPQVSDYQIALTTGINLNVGETTPDNVSTQKIYRENIEWSTSASGEGTVDFNNTTFPFEGSKDILVSSYGNIERMQFTRSGTGTMNGSEVLKMHIALKDTLKAGRTIRVLFLNNNTPLSSNIVPITKNYGLDPNRVGQYQTIQMPASYFQFTSNDYNRIIIYATGYDTTGTGGFYIDDIELQSGINNTPPPTTSSNKVDSVTIKKMILNGDTAHIAYNWINGIAYPKKDTIWTQTQDTSYHLSLTGIHPIFFEQITKDSANIRFRTDSLPALSYPNTRDTSDWANNTLIDKQYFNDRISTISGVGTGAVNSVTGNPSNLVNNTDPANPVVQSDATKADKSTTLTINGIAHDLSTNSTWTISSAGTTADSTITATAGQTSFTFSSVPTSTKDYVIFINGNATESFTASGNIITLTITDLLAGDKVRYKRIK